MELNSCNRVIQNLGWRLFKLQTPYLFAFEHHSRKDVSHALFCQPQTNVTKSAARTPQPTTKGWAKPEAVSIPLSQIQQDEAKLKSSAPVGLKYILVFDLYSGCKQIRK